MNFTSVSIASMPKSFSPPRGERVGLVDEEHAAERRLERLLRLQRGLPDVAGDETRAIRLDEVTAVDDAEGAIDLAQEPGDGRLPRAGLPLKTR
jgi:hypothetical protein